MEGGFSSSTVVLDFDRWRSDPKEHRKASGGSQRPCAVVLKGVELDRSGRGKGGGAPTQRVACKPEEDGLVRGCSGSGFEINLGLKSFFTCSRMLSVPCMLKEF